MPAIDDSYLFNEETTLAIPASWYTTGESDSGLSPHGQPTHVEQVMRAQLALHPDQPRQPCQPDHHGKDAIVQHGQQAAEFKAGLLPALQRVLTVFDEYDAGRPDVMFVIRTSRWKALTRSTRAR